eukprot:2486999-Rhodomonas_salina.1
MKAGKKKGKKRTPGTNRAEKGARTFGGADLELEGGAVLLEGRVPAHVLAQCRTPQYRSARSVPHTPVLISSLSAAHPSTDQLAQCRTPQYRSARSVPHTPVPISSLSTAHSAQPYASSVPHSSVQHNLVLISSLSTRYRAQSYASAA